MSLCEWSTSNLEYGRRVLSSGLEGARYGREAFLHGRSLAPFLRESVQQSWGSGAVGTCIGVLCCISGKRYRSLSRALACGFVGGAIGLGLGIAWNSRRLTESITSGALRHIGRTRDEHWLESHPIDYA